ncbi:MAG: hypothetical protein ACI9QQ_000857 [Myxococcota bacterium]|jgi:hypothetical protein
MRFSFDRSHRQGRNQRRHVDGAWVASLRKSGGIGLAVLLLVAVASSASGYAGPTSASKSLTLAYLDPGSGSFVIQALIALFAGIALAGRTYWTTIKGFLGIASSDDEDEDDDLDDTSGSS